MSSELAACLARFFEQGRGPSHDELSRLFASANLTRFDPARDGSAEKVGKLKRVRAVLLGGFESEPIASLALSRQLVAVLQARGSFDTASEHFAGTQVIAATQRAFSHLGWRLDMEGELYPLALGGLEGRQLSEALQSYVRRIQRGTSDTALTIGTAKDLLEAAARHVVVEATGEYDKRSGFPATFVRACATRGISIPPTTLVDAADADPFAALEQALVLAALAVNRLRNLEGTGHGRPQPSLADRRQGVIASHASAAVCYLLLPELEQ